MSPIEKMTAAMLVCGVAQEIIDAAVMSATQQDFFAAPAVVKMGLREANAFFDSQFWPNYPKRDGQNPKEPTRKKIVAALISGENPEAILAGLARLVQDLGRRSKIGTEFVPRAITWVNGKGWKDDPTDASAVPPTSPIRTNGNGGMGFYAAANSIRPREEATDERPGTHRPT